MSLFEALKVSGISMGIVFFVLSLISFMLYLFKFIKNPAKKSEPEKITKDFDKIKDEEANVAIIMASILAAEDTEGANIKIKSIREIVKR
ncbi:MAG: OadG family protein [Fusobacteriaceae bacterium]